MLVLVPVLGLGITGCSSDRLSGRYTWDRFNNGAFFNAANILLSAAISIAGMAVAFPVGIGLALVLGVLVNYFAEQ